MLLATLLRRDGNVPDVTAGVLEAMWPKRLFGWLDAVSGTMQKVLPTPSTISRHRLPFVAAYMLCWQNAWKELGPSTWYLQVDSSPQFGRDWLPCVVSFVRDCDWVRVCQILRELYRLGQEQAAANATADSDDGTAEAEIARSRRRGLLLTKMEGLMRHHTLVVGALGSSRATLMHKLHVLLHEYFSGHWRMAAGI